jgi:N-acetylmuramoyl-L-alanine amidase
MALKLLRNILTACALAAAAIGPARATELLDVRFGVQSPNATRVVLDVLGEPAYVLSGSEQGAGRIFVDLAGTTVGPAFRSPRAAGGQVAAYSVRPVGGKERVAIELSTTAAVAKAFVIPPAGPGQKARIVIDLVAADKAALMASLPSPFKDLAPVIEAATQPQKPQPSPTPPVKTASAAPSQPAPAPASTQSGQLAAVPQASGPPPTLQVPVPPPVPATAAAQPASLITIVIDAGHGGVDPGAHGPTGVIEKNVTLAAANELAAQLRAKGRYNVVLSRASDRRIHLDDRSRIAREAGANLFISLHADAHPDPAVRGGSVYTLSDKGTARAAAEVKNQSDYQIWGEKVAERPRDVSSMLIDLAQRETLNESGKFAAILLSRLKSAAPLLKNSHRREDLYVLLDPGVPAVLFELAFISNADDEKNLNSPAWRKKVMRAVATSIDAYFDQRAVVGRASAPAVKAAP